MTTPASRAAMTTEINANLATNGVGAITATVMRTTFNDFLSGVVAFNGDTNVVTNALLRQSTGLSVIGNATNTTANVADIGPGTANQVLAVNGAGNALAFANLANSFFPTQSAFTIKSNITSGTATPSDNTLTAVIDACIGSTQGNILYRNATVWTVLAPGTANQAVLSGGASANPSYGNVVLSLTGSYPLVVTGTTAPSLSFTGLVSCGRFSRVSNTAVQFVPWNGDLIKINGVNYQIPSGGIAGGTALFAGNSTFVGGTASQNLAASSYYLVCAFLNSSTVTFDFILNGTYATSSTSGNIGTTIKTGDDTRTVVGAIYTNSSAITDSDATRTVLSWFNRQPKRLKASFTASRTTTSTTLAEINSEIRCNFISWADDQPSIGYVGTVTNSGANFNMVGIGLDNGTATVTPVAITNGTTAFASASIPLTEVTGISEGATHFFTVAGAVSAGTGTWNIVSGITGETYPTLSGVLRG